MMVVVSFVSLMVHVYTIGYMQDDPGYNRVLQLHLAVHVLDADAVMSNNFLQLFFGWKR